MTNPSQQVMRLGFGFAVSQALRVVIELGIPDLLASGEQSVEDLAAATKTDAESLYRVMRLLAPEGVFTEVRPRHFTLMEVGAALRSDRPGPRDFIRMVNSEAYLAFEQLLHSVRTGKPAFDKVFGSPRFDWLSAHPEQAALFQRAMIAQGQGSNEAVADAYDFSRYTRVVDVGGGHGQLLSAILARNPHLSGVLLDLASGVAAARQEAGSDPSRTDFVVGDFFDSVPVGDVYVIKKVIHDWDDERAELILRRCREAMQTHGRVLVAETLVPAGDEPAQIKAIDVVMLAVTGGLERTEAQYARLFEAAGLKLERVIDTTAPISILEASPA
ncbi:ubiquinone/menaquinone biosynthesis protein [Mesorhizobium sp. B3-1-3]|uniref:methyltransferase n=1 Tax=unclassified Mesorhizobium TaxID=325217 RepID=UPI0011268BEC|nr:MULTISPECIES: methyltransferase [unclassified Mesorhizobium]TPI62161.1 ubiquinone/menaquinone biosynthesis protein [Mesorhizobium sp. B3-1-8]TPI64159.1 ubiquinone/menaquinone biosynthesis protein [Mesorhizobium sp. B3-1-3]UCI24305.1 acetylserotonin O-methyltransferase [Mesorhizobium sp. B2-8-5]